MITATRLASGVALCCVLSAPVFAAVSQEQAARLGSSLTPVGAERAGNADGSIPEWQGGLPTNAGDVRNGFRSNPFADEKPLFVIDAQNHAQYLDRLSPGQVALFKRYPASYRMPVYPTHRSVGIPADVAQSIGKNALATRLIEDGNGIEHFTTAVPFPIPQNGLEVIWNHIARYRGKSMQRQTSPGQRGVRAGGRRGTLRARGPGDRLRPAERRQPPVLLQLQDHRAVAPGGQRPAGARNPQPGEGATAGLALQRRPAARAPCAVRRAPQVSYDGPGTAADGMRTADGLEHFNGSPDRYDWKLVGKREMYIPYNSYLAGSPDIRLKDLLLPGHLNPDFTRYELHRVWEVVATLKPGERHIYAKRHLYIDEDTWAISLADHYDNRDAIWRVGESHLQYFYDVQASHPTPEALYDLIAGRYIASGMINERPMAYDFTFKASKKDFLPATLRTMGIR